MGYPIFIDVLFIQPPARPTRLLVPTPEGHVYTVLIPILQDTVVIVPPNPFTLQDPLDVPIGDSFYSRPQLFFTCHVRPKDCRQPTRTNYIHCPDDILLELLFFSTFQLLDLPNGASWSAETL